MDLSKWNGWKGFCCRVKNYFSRPFEQREEGFTMTGQQFTTQGTCGIIHLADLFYNTFRNILGERKCSPWHSLLLIIVSERAHFECRRHANNQQERVKDYIHGYNACNNHCRIKWKGHEKPWCGQNSDSQGAIASCITLPCHLSPAWCTQTLKRTSKRLHIHSQMPCSSDSCILWYRIICFRLEKVVQLPPCSNFPRAQKCTIILLSTDMTHVDYRIS